MIFSRRVDPPKSKQASKGTEDIIQKEASSLGISPARLRETLIRLAGYAAIDKLHEPASMETHRIYASRASDALFYVTLFRSSGTFDGLVLHGTSNSGVAEGSTFRRHRGAEHLYLFDGNLVLSNHEPIYEDFDD